MSMLTWNHVCTNTLLTLPHAALFRPCKIGSRHVKSEDSRSALFGSILQLNLCQLCTQFLILIEGVNIHDMLEILFNRQHNELASKGKEQLGHQVPLCWGRPPISNTYLMLKGPTYILP